MRMQSAFHLMDHILTSRDEPARRFLDSAENSCPFACKGETEFVMSATQMLARRLVGSVVRYAVVGLAISLVYSVGVVLLVALLSSRNATLASMLAFIGVAPIAYIAHRYLTFFNASHDAWQPLRFAITTTSSFLVVTIGMYVVTEVFGSSYLVGIALNWVLIPTINFVIYFIWVFRAGMRPVAAEAQVPTGTPRGAGWSTGRD